MLYCFWAYTQRVLYPTKDTGVSVLVVVLVTIASTQNQLDACQQMNNEKNIYTQRDFIQH